VDASGGHAASIERIGRRVEYAYAKCRCIRSAAGRNQRGRGARELVGRIHNLVLLALIGMALLLVYGLTGWLWG
jgi:hypothetical protein